MAEKPNPKIPIYEGFTPPALKDEAMKMLYLAMRVACYRRKVSPMTADVCDNIFEVARRLYSSRLCSMFPGIELKNVIINNPAADDAAKHYRIVVASVKQGEYKGDAYMINDNSFVIDGVANYCLQYVPQNNA